MSNADVTLHPSIIVLGSEILVVFVSTIACQKRLESNLYIVEGGSPRSQAHYSYSKTSCCSDNYRMLERFSSE